MLAVRATRVILLALMCLASSLANAFTKEQAIKIAEQTFKAIAENLQLYTESCLFFTKECGLIGNEFYVLRAMTLEKIYYHNPTIIFDSEAEHPGSFLIDGQIRIGKTGSKAGDSIIINRDMILQANIFGGYDPLTLTQSIAIVVHELGHHYDDLALRFSLPIGVIDQHEQLDVIGSKVSSFVEGRSQRAFVGGEVHPMLDRNADVSFENYIQEAGSGAGDYNYGSLSRTYVRGSFGYIDITENIAQLTRCPTITVDGLSRLGAPINLYFENFEKSFARLDNDDVHLQIKILGEAHLNCASDFLDSFNGFHNGVIDIYFKIDGSELMFDPNRMRLRIDVPADQVFWSKGN